LKLLDKTRTSFLLWK